MARAPRAQLFTAADELEPEPKADREGWFDIDSAPKDGKVIMVRGEKPEKGPAPEEIAVWRNSRCFNAKTTKWDDVGFWALANAGGARLPFEPMAWKPRMGIM